MLAAFSLLASLLAQKAFSLVETLNSLPAFICSPGHHSCCNYLIHICCSVQVDGLPGNFSWSHVFLRLFRWHLREIAICQPLESWERSKEHMQCTMSIGEVNGRLSYLSCQILKWPAAQLSIANCILGLSKPIIRAWGSVSNSGSILSQRPKRLPAPLLNLFLCMWKLLANFLILVRISIFH